MKRIRQGSVEVAHYDIGSINNLWPAKKKNGTAGAGVDLDLNLWPAKKSYGTAGDFNCLVLKGNRKRWQ